MPPSSGLKRPPRVVSGDKVFLPTSWLSEAGRRKEHSLHHALSAFDEAVKHSIAALGQPVASHSSHSANEDGCEDHVALGSKCGQSTDDGTEEHLLQYNHFIICDVIKETFLRSIWRFVFHTDSLLAHISLCTHTPVTSVRVLTDLVGTSAYGFLHSTGTFIHVKALDTITLITLVTFLATGWSGAHAADAGLGTVLTLIGTFCVDAKLVGAAMRHFCATFVYINASPVM